MKEIRKIRIRLVTPVDIIVVLLPVLVSLAALPRLRNGDRTFVVVYRDNEILAKYSLGDDVTFPVRGYHGPMRIAIEDSSVRVLQSSCANKVCIHTGIITSPNRQIVCAPNHVLIQIQKSSDSGEIDALAR